MEKDLKPFYLKLGVAIEITIWVFLFSYIISGANFQDLIVNNVLGIMNTIVLFHILAYDIALIAKIVIEKKVSKIKNVKAEIQEISKICPSCGAEILDKTGPFCSKCGVSLK